MKRQIHGKFTLLMIIAIIVTTVLGTLVNYTVLRKEVIGDLQNYARTLKDTVYHNGVQEGEDKLVSEYRITLVDTSGKVVYDNQADIRNMGNHANRQEVKTAQKEGEGQAVRRSETIGKSTVYYAVCLDDGIILRVAKDSSSILGVLMSALPIMMVMILIVMICSILITSYLTKSIVAPIEKMAQHIDNLDPTEVYRELRPFVNKIKRQHQEILQTAEIRQEFTANVSHELKTPLTAISGYAELIHHGMVQGEEVRHFAGEIHQNANRLLTLINDIIRLSELDAKGLEITFEPVDLQKSAMRCVGLLQVSAEKHHVRLEMQGTHCVIQTNTQMIDELMYNLVDNGIRYNKEDGLVCLTVGTDEQGKVYMEVEDTGIGIPQEHQERIFERFYRVDKSRSKSTGGTGLGLAIVKHIVVQLRGQMTLHSAEGVGTKIRITFADSNGLEEHR